MEEEAETARPSFSTFWQRTKNAAKQVSSKTRYKIRVKRDNPDPYAVTEDDDSDPDNGDGKKDRNDKSDKNESTPLTKAQIRRAQVRRAQVQHRKRKADYLRQLEVDVHTLRDLLTATEKETRVLWHENAAIRAQLHLPATDAAGDSPSPPPLTDADIPAVVLSAAPTVSPSTTLSWDAGTSTAGLSPMTLSSSASPAVHNAEAKDESIVSLFDDIDLDDITVTLVMDESVGTPVYRIASAPTSALAPALCAADTALQSISLSSLGAVDPLLYASPVAASMASLDLSAAPGCPAAPALLQMTREQVHVVVNFVLALEHVCWNHAGHQFCKPTAGFCAAGHALTASGLLLRNAPETVHQTVYSKTDHDHDCPDADSDRYVLSWQAPDISLQTLFGLAASLNPAMDKELAPVQAWFDMAARYPLALLLRPDVMDALKRAFTGVVTCLYFGAVIERAAYESIVARILDPLMAATSVLA